MSIKDWAKSFSANISNPKIRPPLEGIYVYLLALSLGYAVADLSVLSLRPNMLPQKAPPEKPVSRMRSQGPNLAAYKKIEDRNLFNYEGKIPPELSADEKPESVVDDGPAVPSNLPIKLLGTIVHINPLKSIGTINMSSQNKTESFRVGESIDTLAKVINIERRKVIIRNLANGKKEYIEIPDDNKITFGLKSPKPTQTASTEEVKAEGQNKFSIKRSTLEKYTADLSSVLNQARMVPNIVPGSGGRIDGFRFVSIQPDSIFSQLGFKPGDVIKGVDGEPVTSPTQAMEMYNAMKSSDRLSLDITRDGKEQVFDYTIE